VYNGWDELAHHVFADDAVAVPVQRTAAGVVPAADLSNSPVTAVPVLSIDLQSRMTWEEYLSGWRRGWIGWSERVGGRAALNLITAWTADGIPSRAPAGNAEASPAGTWWQNPCTIGGRCCDSRAAEQVPERREQPAGGDRAMQPSLEGLLRTCRRWTLMDWLEHLLP
jgi:hypothetical protein